MTSRVPESSPALSDSTLERLAAAKHIAVLTGAGMSADSGMPTYRSGPDALWNNGDASEVASVDAWHRQPLKVWTWLMILREKMLACEPNAGHLALARLAASFQVTILTQNIDDLHERAGSETVRHMHGQVRTVVCIHCRQHAVPHADAESLMVCPRCGQRMRPDVVLFNEQLNPDDWTFAQQTVRRCDALLVVGTSCQVHPVATLPVLARRKRKLVVEINPNPTQTTSVAHECLRTTAAPGLPWLVDTLLDRTRPTPTPWGGATQVVAPSRSLRSTERPQRATASGRPNAASRDTPPKGARIATPHRRSSRHQ